jgi:hypothetical protein
MTYQTEATELGRAAFIAGIKCTPVLDINVMALIRRENPSGIIGAPSTMKIFKAWTRGWTSANLAA